MNVHELHSAARVEPRPVEHHRCALWRRVVTENQQWLTDVGDIVIETHTHPHIDVAHEPEGGVEWKELRVSRTSRHDRAPDDRRESVKKVSFEEDSSRGERIHVMEDD